MKKVLKMTTAACLLALGMPAQSQILWDTLDDNTLNFYEDQDRETIFDIDGDGEASVGDVFIGYARIDDHSLPLPGESVSGELYSVFSITMTDKIETVNADGTTSYEFLFGSTTQAGLTLADFGVTGTDANSMTAVYEDVGANLISGLPGGGGSIDLDGDGRLTIFDFMLEITNDTQDLVGGLEDGVDHWGSTGEVATLGDPIANLALLESATLNGGLPGGATIGFHAGLGITWSDAAGGYLEDCTGAPTEQCWARLVEDDVEAPLITLHELTIQNGDTSGASDLVFGADGNPYFSGVAAGGTGTLLGFNFYGISTNADFGLYPRNVSVPEPSILALMGLGMFGMGVARRRRKA